MSESKLLSEIIKAVYDNGNMIYRINTGTVKMENGKRFSTGVPAGFSDCMGFRPDGQVFFIEVKVKPNKASQKQIDFIEKVRQRGALAGVAYNIDEALAIVNGEGE